MISSLFISLLTNKKYAFSAGNYDFTEDSWSYEVISVKWTAMQIGLNTTPALKMISMFV